jgi:hypothetical protein
MAIYLEAPIFSMHIAYFNLGKLYKELHVHDKLTLPMTYFGINYFGEISPIKNLERPIEKAYFHD